MQARRMPQPRRSAFTLMETLIALSIFSLAVVALAEAIQQSGKAANLIKQEVQIHGRLTSITAETMRLVALAAAGARPQNPPVIEEYGVTYKVATTQIKNLMNKDKQPVEGLWEIRATAEWMEGSVKQQMEDVAWVYPPMLPPLQ